MSTTSQFVCFVVGAISVVVGSTILAGFGGFLVGIGAVALTMALAGIIEMINKRQ
jgi:multisubunit Na+/H+ antiporter MnhB subunit